MSGSWAAHFQINLKLKSLLQKNYFFFLYEPLMSGSWAAHQTQNVLIINIKMVITNTKRLTVIIYHLTCRKTVLRHIYIT